jgi:RND family efflux transporter MFP subunit
VSRRLLISLAVLSLAVACKKKSEGGDDDEKKTPVKVTCQAVTSGKMDESVSLRGVIASPPDRDDQVAPAVSGRIATVDVHEGDRVVKGQLLATVDDPSLAGAMAEAQAAVETAQAQLAQANAAAARAKRLVDEGISAGKDLEDATAKAAAAAADLRAATAKREVASKQKARADMVAPIPGTIIHVFRKAGELVDGTPTTPIVEIADPTTLELAADAPAADLVRLTQGAAAEIHLDALPEQTIPGIVFLVAPAVDPTTAQGLVRVRVDAPPDLAAHLRIGLAGNATIKLAQRDAKALVPATALRRGPTGKDELVVCEGTGEDIKAAIHTVRIGRRTAQTAEIVEGVEPGDRVVTDHVLGLTDDTPLIPADAAGGDEKRAEK